MARVRLVDVVKRFGKTIAVDHINLDIKDGEFFALLGPSGSGKSTTLRLIAGLEVPDEGEIWIDDKLVNNVHPKHRDVAMVFQNYALYPHLKVFDNIAFPLIARKKELGLTKEDIKKRVIEVAKMLNIVDLLDRYPNQLSGGQQQRVALARALVRRPKVWLLDEPLSNLDAKLRLMMRVELKKLQKELGITTIYVTHDQIEAMSMADRIAVMDRGKILQVGTPYELYYKPANTFVATFIGTPPMNLINCVFRELSEPVKLFNKQEKTKYVLEYHTIRIPIPETIGNEIKKKGYGPEIILGIRPEFMRLSKEPPAGKEGIIKTRVIVVEPLGSEIIVTIKINDDLLRVKMPPGVSFRMNEEVYLDIDWDKIILFDGKTGKSII